jgi:hypothetical protein
MRKRQARTAREVLEVQQEKNALPAGQCGWTALTDQRERPSPLCGQSDASRTNGGLVGPRTCRLLELTHGWLLVVSLMAGRSIDRVAGPTRSVAPALDWSNNYPTGATQA